MKSPEVIRPEVVAAAIQISIKTVTRWVREGRLPDYDMNVGYRFRWWKLETLVAHNPQIGSLIEDYLRDQETAQ
jgi:hypothetical protein